MSVFVFSSPAEVGVLTPCSDASKTKAQREEIAHPLSSRWESWSQDFCTPSDGFPSLGSSVGMETSLSEQGSGG